MERSKVTDRVWIEVGAALQPSDTTPLLRFTDDSRLGEPPSHDHL